MIISWAVNREISTFMRELKVWTCCAERWRFVSLFWPHKSCSCDAIQPVMQTSFVCLFISILPSIRPSVCRRPPVQLLDQLYSVQKVRYKSTRLTDWCSCELKVIAANSHIFPALTRRSHTLHAPKPHCFKWDQWAWHTQLEHLLFEYPHVCRFIREDITLWNHINGLIVPFYDFKLALCVAAMSVWNKSRLSARVCGFSFFSKGPEVK